MRACHCTTFSKICTEFGTRFSSDALVHQLCYVVLRPLFDILQDGILT